MHAAGPDPWPGGCECGGGDTMNALAANDVMAAGLLALARLAGGAPGRCGPAMAPAWPPRTGHEGTTLTPGATRVRPSAPTASASPKATSAPSPASSPRP